MRRCEPTTDSLRAGPIRAQELPGAVSGAMAAKAFKVRAGPGRRKYGLAAGSLAELLRKASLLEVGGEEEEEEGGRASLWES